MLRLWIHIAAWNKVSIPEKVHGASYAVHEPNCATTRDTEGALRLQDASTVLTVLLCVPAWSRILAR